MDLCEKKITDYKDGIDRMIYDTGASYFDFLFGNNANALEIIKKFFLRKSNLFSYNNCTGYFNEDDTLVGIEHGYSHRDYPRLLLNTLKEGFNIFNVLVFIVTFTRAMVVAIITPSIPKKTYYIAYFSVNPLMRGRGIGAIMLTKTLSRLKVEGYNYCELDVESDNISAIKLYQSCGLIIIRNAVPKRKLFGMKSRYRMRVTL